MGLYVKQYVHCNLYQKINTKKLISISRVLKCGSINTKILNYLIAYINNQNLNGNNILSNISLQKLKIDKKSRTWMRKKRTNVKIVRKKTEVEVTLRSEAVVCVARNLMKGVQTFNSNFFLKNDDLNYQNK